MCTLLVLWQLVDIRVHVRRDATSWQHLGANVVMILFGIILAIIRYLLSAPKAAVTVASVAGGAGYVLFGALFLAMEGASRAGFFIFFGLTLLLYTGCIFTCLRYGTQQSAASP